MGAYYREMDYIIRGGPRGGKKGEWIHFPKDGIHKIPENTAQISFRNPNSTFALIHIKNIDDPKYAGRFYFDFILAKSQTDLMKLTREDFKFRTDEWLMPAAIAMKLTHKKASSISPEEFAHLLSCRPIHT